MSQCPRNESGNGVAELLRLWRGQGRWEPRWKEEEKKGKNAEHSRSRNRLYNIESIAKEPSRNRAGKLMIRVVSTLSFPRYRLTTDKLLYRHAI